MFNKYKTIIILLLIGTVLIIPIILPYFHSGYFPTHDGEWAVVRAGEMFREIRDRQFPPRMSGALNFGYGYPLFNFTYPFPYYLSTFLHIFKFGFIDSIKIIFAVSVLFSFYSMFALSFYFWKNKWAGFVSALLYVYLPYRLVDLYVRGSIGESIAFVLYPLLVLFCYVILIQKKKNILVFFLVLLSAVLILTHNIMAVYFGIIFVFYLLALLLSKRYTDLAITSGAFVWGALISSFFFVPALIEKPYIKLSKIPIADRDLYYVTVQKLFFSPFGYETPTGKNPFTYQLGITQVVGFLLGITSMFRLRSVEKNIVILFSILTFVFIFMMFPVSEFVWKLPLLSDINYPWTLLLPIGFLMTFLGGGVVKSFKYGKQIGLLLVVITIALTVLNAKPELYKNISDDYYVTNEATTTSSNELMPLWVQKEPTKRFINKIEAQGTLANTSYSSNKISFILNSQAAQAVVINQIFYPGWKGTINGKPASLKRADNNGVMIIAVPQGRSNVMLAFTETPLRLVVDILSIISFISLVIFGIISVYLYRKHPFKKKR